MYFFQGGEFTCDWKFRLWPTNLYFMPSPFNWTDRFLWRFDGPDQYRWGYFLCHGCYSQTSSKWNSNIFWPKSKKCDRTEKKNYAINKYIYSFIVRVVILHPFSGNNSPGIPIGKRKFWLKLKHSKDLPSPPSTSYFFGI